MNALLSLELDSVCKAYGSTGVLSGFSGTFVSGRIGAIVGPNGAGKTTLLRIVAGLQTADSGRVRCGRGGRVLYYGGFDTLPLRGTVNQFRNALGVGPVDRGERRLRTLSRGELQHVGLRVALELAPEVVLLDEPWTALEPDLRESLNDDLRSLASNRVVVCSSHDLDEVARIADDFVFLTNGVGIWKRREDGFATRDQILRHYRQHKG